MLSAIWEAVVGYGMVCQCLAVVEWFFYIYLLVWMPMSLLKCTSTVYGGFLKCFHFFQCKIFTHISMECIFFFSKQNLMNFWLCDFNKLFSLLPKTLLWFTLLFFHLFSIYSFLSLLLRNGLHTWQNYMEYQILKTLLVIYQIINYMQNRDVIFVSV